MDKFNTTDSATLVSDENINNGLDNNLLAQQQEQDEFDDKLNERLHEHSMRRHKMETETTTLTSVNSLDSRLDAGLLQEPEQIDEFDAMLEHRQRMQARWENKLNIIEEAYEKGTIGANEEWTEHPEYSYLVQGGPLVSKEMREYNFGNELASLYDGNVAEGLDRYIGALEGDEKLKAEQLRTKCAMPEDAVRLLGKLHIDRLDKAKQEREDFKAKLNKQAALAEGAFRKMNEGEDLTPEEMACITDDKMLTAQQVINISTALRKLKNSAGVMSIHNLDKVADYCEDPVVRAWVLDRIEHYGEDERKSAISGATFHSWEGLKRLLRIAERRVPELKDRIHEGRVSASDLVKRNAKLASYENADNTSAAKQFMEQMPQLHDLSHAEGLLEAGNIDPYKRKIEHRADGSIATVESFSVNLDGTEVLLPRVIDGKTVSVDDAVAHYRETGEHLGKFDSVEHANAFAQKYHENQAIIYGGKNNLAAEIANAVPERTDDSTRLNVGLRSAEGQKAYSSAAPIAPNRLSFRGHAFEAYNRGVAKAEQGIMSDPTQSSIDRMLHTLSNAAGGWISTMTSFAPWMSNVTKPFAALDMVSERIENAWAREYEYDPTFKRADEQTLFNVTAAQSATDIGAMLLAGKAAGGMTQGARMFFPAAARTASSSYVGIIAKNALPNMVTLGFSLPSAQTAGAALGEWLFDDERGLHSKSYEQLKSMWDPASADFLGSPQHLLETALVSLTLAAPALRGAKTEIAQAKAEKKILDTTRGIIPVREALNLARQGTPDALLRRLKEEALKDPEKVYKQLSRNGKDVIKKEQLEDMSRNGVIEEVLRQAGVTDAKPRTDGKTEYVFAERDADGKDKLTRVVWSNEQRDAWVGSKVERLISDAAENFQSRLRAEKLARAAEQDVNAGRIISLLNMPQTALARIPKSELASGVLSAKSLRILTQDIAENIQGWKEHGYNDRQLDSLRTAADTAEQRLAHENDTNGHTAARSNSFPAFQFGGANPGELVTYLARGEITESEVLHELTERQVRNMLERNPDSLPQLLKALQQVQQEVGSLLPEGKRLLPDKPTDQLTYLNAVEAMTELATSDFLTHHADLNLSKQTHSALDAIVHNLADAQSVTLLADAYRAFAKNAGEGGAEARALLRDILAETGAKMTDYYRKGESEGNAAALNAVRERQAKKDAAYYEAQRARERAARAEQGKDTEKPDNTPTEPPASAETAPSAKEHPAETAPKPTTPERPAHEPYPERGENDTPTPDHIKPLTPEESADLHESTYVPKETPADESPIGETIPAEINRADSPVDQESGAYIPERNMQGFTGVGKNGKGRGLVNNEYYLDPAGNLHGSAEISSLILPPELQHSRLIPAAGEREIERKPVTVLRDKDGKLTVVDGLARLAEAKTQGRFVDVRVLDADPRKPHQLADLTTEYLASIGQANPFQLQDYITRHKLSRAEADKRGLIMRDTLTAEELPASKSAWDLVNMTRDKNRKHTFNAKQREALDKICAELDAADKKEEARRAEVQTKIEAQVKEAEKRATGSAPVTYATRKGREYTPLREMKRDKDLARIIEHAEASAAQAKKWVKNKGDQEVSYVLGYLKGQLAGINEILGGNERPVAAIESARRYVDNLIALYEGKDPGANHLGLTPTDYMDLLNATPKVRRNFVINQIHGAIDRVLVETAHSIERKRIYDTIGLLDATLKDAEPIYAEHTHHSRSNSTAQAWKDVTRRRELMDLTPEEKDEAAAKLEAQIAATVAKTDNESVAAREAALRDLAELQTFGAAQYKTIGEVRDIVDTIVTDLKQGRSMWYEIQELKRRRAEKRQQEIAEAVPNTNTAANAEKDNTGSKTTGLIGRFFASFRSMHDLAFRFEDRAGMRFLKEFRKAAAKELTQHVASRRRDQIALRDFLSKDLGLKRENDVRKWVIDAMSYNDTGIYTEASLDFKTHRNFPVDELRRILALPPEERAKERVAAEQSGTDDLSARYYPSEDALMKAAERLQANDGAGIISTGIDITEKVFNDNAKEHLRITKFVAAQLILTYEQPTYTLHMQRNGYTQDVIDQLRAYAGDSVMRYAYWCRDRLHAKNIGQHFEERTGCPFLGEKNYWPGKWNRSSAAENSAGMFEQAATGMGLYPFLITRVEHSWKPDLTIGVNQVYESAMEHARAYIYKGETSDNVRRILADRDTADRVKSVIGAHNFDMFTQGLEVRDSAYMMDAVASRPQKMLARAYNSVCAIAYLAGSPITAFRNLSGVTNAFGDEHFRGLFIGKARAARSTAYLAGKSLQWILEALTRNRLHWDDAPMTVRKMADTDMFRNRFVSDEAYQRLTSMPQGSRIGYFRWLQTQGMKWSTEMPDVYSNALGYTLLYNDLFRTIKKKAPDTPDEVVHQMCAARVEQSLMLDAQPTEPEARPLRAITGTDMWAIDNFFLKYEPVKKIVQQTDLFRKGVEKGGLNGLWTAVSWAIGYGLEYSLIEHSIVMAYDWLVNDYDEKLHGSDVWTWFLLNELYAVSGAPMLNVVPGWQSLILANLNSLNQKRLKNAGVKTPEKYSIANLASAGMTSDLGDAVNYATDLGEFGSWIIDKTFGSNNSSQGYDIRTAAKKGKKGKSGSSNEYDSNPRKWEWTAMMTLRYATIGANLMFGKGLGTKAGPIPSENVASALGELNSMANLIRPYMRHRQVEVQTEKSKAAADKKAKKARGNLRPD